MVGLEPAASHGSLDLVVRRMWLEPLLVDMLLLKC